MSIPISQLTNGGLPNGNIEIPATNPLNTTQSINGTTFKYILADILQYILIAQGFTTYTSCRVATTAALTATYANGVAGVGATLTNAGAQVALSIDGVTLALNDRVLIKNQINTFENGIYVVTDVGGLTSNWVLTRATDYNEPAEIVYLGVVAITQGTQNGSLVFQENSPGPFVIGTSPITFQQLQIDITLLPSASPANKLLRSDGTYWVQSTNASLDASDKLYDLSELQVDNININGNTITSSNVGGNIVITPNTVGSIVLDGLNWPQVDGTSGQAITTNGSGQLGWSTVSTVTTPTTDKAIAIFNGTSGALQNSSITIPASNILSGVGQIDGANGEPVLVTYDTVNAVNYFNFYSQISGSTPLFGVNGTDANIGMTISTKGTGTFGIISESASNQITMYTGAGAQHNTNFQFPTTLANQTVTFPDLTGTVALSGAGQSVSFGSLSLTTPLGISSGGTNASIIGANGTLAQSDGTKYTFTTATYPSLATATGTILRADGTNWVATTATYPNTTSINHILYSSAANVIGEIADTVGGVLVSNNTGVPSMLANPSDNYRVLQSKNAAIPEWSVAAYPHTASANGTLMQSDGTDWTHTQATYPSSTNKDHILYSSANNTVGEIATQKDAVLVSNHSNTPVWSSSMTDGQIIIGKTNDIPAAASITGSGSITVTPGPNSLTISSSASGTVNAGTANQLAYYATTGSAVSGLATANSATLVTSSTGVPAWTSSMTNGQILIGSTGATPVPATLTAGPGISIANAAGSVTISGTGSGIGWTEVTGTSQTMSADNGYVSSNAGLVTLTLPTTAAFGTVINVQGKGAGGWKIAQNAGQVIHFGNVDTTTGATGYLASTNRYDSIQLLCITANTDWAVMSTQGVVTYN